MTQQTKISFDLCATEFKQETKRISAERNLLESQEVAANDFVQKHVRELHTQIFGKTPSWISKFLARQFYWISAICYVVIVSASLLVLARFVSLFASPGLTVTFLDVPALMLASWVMYAHVTEKPYSVGTLLGELSCHVTFKYAAEVTPGIEMLSLNRLSKKYDGQISNDTHDLADVI